jgi:hypothetical protein
MTCAQNTRRSDQPSADGGATEPSAALLRAGKDGHPRTKIPARERRVVHETKVTYQEVNLGDCRPSLSHLEVARIEKQPAAHGPCTCGAECFVTH